MQNMIAKWTELGFYLPEPDRRMVKYCIKFEKLKRRLIKQSKTGYVDFTKLAELNTVTYNILASYIEIVKREASQEDVDKLTSEIQETLRIMLRKPSEKERRDTMGPRQSMEDRFVTAREQNILDIEIPLYIGKISNFIYPKIYDSLKEAVDKGKQFTHDQVSFVAIQKLGIEPVETSQQFEQRPEQREGRDERYEE